MIVLTSFGAFTYTETPLETSLTPFIITEAPLKVNGFNVDGMLAIGQELINNKETINCLVAEKKELEERTGVSRRYMPKKESVVRTSPSEMYFGKCAVMDTQANLMWGLSGNSTGSLVTLKAVWQVISVLKITELKLFQCMKV